ncbi:MAG: amidohydrolase [Bacillota bacterium]
MSILIKDAAILSMEDERAIFTADLAIIGNKIAMIAQDKGQQNYQQVIDGRGLLAMPGLINTHSHAGMSLFRGYGDDLELMVWLSERIWPKEALLTADDIAKGSLLSMVEMIKSGTTCFADMYFEMDAVAEAVASVGMRAVLSEGMTGQEEKLEKFPHFYRRWQGAHDGLISVMLGPHAPYTCSPDYLREVIALAKEYAAPIHIHLAETRFEVAQMQELYQKRPVELMAELGLFAENKVLAAHGVYIDESEMELLQGHDVSIAHNPCSNMKLASGIAPIGSFLDKGINVSIGTDSACSNNNLDMFAELRTAALLAKVATADSTVLPAGEALKMATVNGAKALGYPNLGQLKEGMLADLILIDLDGPHLQPPTDPVSNLVYAASGSDVNSVIINGKLVMKKRELLTVDEEKIKFAANQVAKRLL